MADEIRRDDLAESHAITDHVHPCQCPQQRRVRGRQYIGSPDEHAARLLEHTALARRHRDRRELVVQLLRV